MSFCEVLYCKIKKKKKNRPIFLKERTHLNTIPENLATGAKYFFLTNFSRTDTINVNFPFKKKCDNVSELLTLPLTGDSKLIFPQMIPFPD